jgi:hypothetical protein
MAEGILCNEFSKSRPDHAVLYSCYFSSVKVERAVQRCHPGEWRPEVPISAHNTTPRATKITYMVDTTTHLPNEPLTDPISHRAHASRS